MRGVPQFAQYILSPPLATDFTGLKTSRNIYDSFHPRFSSSSRNVGEPEIDCLPDTDKEANHRAEQLDCLEMLLGDRKHQLFEFCQRIVRTFLRTSPPTSNSAIATGKRSRAASVIRSTSAELARSIAFCET